MAFATLDDDEEKELLRLSRFYRQEAKRCEKSKAYLAGCVMLGSALETFLMLMVNIFEGEAEQTGKIPMEKGKAETSFGVEPRGTAQRSQSSRLATGSARPK